MSSRRRALLSALALVLLWCGMVAAPGNQADVSAEILAIRVPVLTYHAVDYSGSAYSVTPEQLDAQCRWLVENGYTAITLYQFWEATTGATILPPNPVVLTNDDGWTSALTFAETLGRHGLVGNYFINNMSPLSADQILTLSHYGAVEAHTVSHMNMIGLDYDTQFAEIAQNKAYIEQITGRPVHFLAWPFGDSDTSAVQAAAAAGIIGAFGLGGTAANTAAVDPYYVPRIMIEVTDDISTFAAKVGYW